MGWLLITFLGAAIGTLIGFTCLNKADRKDIYKYVPYTVPWFFVIMFLWGFIGLLISNTSSGVISKHRSYAGCEKDVVSYPIISTFREKTVSGSFVLGTGGVNSVDRYYTYVEYEQGMKLNTFRTYNTYIREGDDDPHYERIDYYCPATFKDWFGFSSGNTTYNKGRYGTLHVPTGTILRDFKL